MSKSFLARSLHKWLGLIVGLQVLIWLGTGLYMVVLDLDFIHGDPLVKNTGQNLPIPGPGQVTMTSLQQKYPQAASISLQAVKGQPFYLVSTSEARYLINPDNGFVVSPLDEDIIREIALYHYNSNGAIENIQLLTEDPPREIGRRPLPIWRVDFDDRFSTSFYIHPDSGVLATRRHTYWRIFDFFFMLHIMDYVERADAHNLLLKVAQFVGTGFAISGLWLLFYSFNRRRKAANK